MNKRTFSPYELTHLSRHHRTSADVIGNTPVEYVTGKADFCGLEFAISPVVLIPRVETEGLVELALQALSERVLVEPQKLFTVLEVGTGSGAVIISIAKQLEFSGTSISYSASDISNDALKIAEKNATNHQVPITFTQSNLFEKIPKNFDLIVANLPYIPSTRIAELEPSVREHEPITALDGGGDGFSLIHKLLEAAPSHLLPNGSIVLELDDTHTTDFFKDFESVFSVTFFPDCFGRHRFARLDLR